MYRFHGDATEENGDMETPLGRSYHHSTMSAISANNSASSSKAVLAALRALQEKIRRLETERAQAFDEATQLRHAIKNQEIEAEHSKQRDNLATQKSLQDAKSMYEKVQSEKTDLEIRLSKLEDKNRTDNRLLEELKLRIRGLEEEKYNGQSRIKDLEDERSQLQFEIQQSTQKEKDLADTMVWETKRHEEEIEELNHRLRASQKDLSAAANEKSLVDKKLIELDQLVGQLLSVNETLVAQLSGKPVNTLVKKKKNVISKRFIPRVASVSTASTDANRAAGTSQYRSLHSAPTSLPKESVDGLHKMHKMYVDLARGITHGKGKKTPKIGTKKEPQAHTTRIKKKKEKNEQLSKTVMSTSRIVVNESGFGNDSFTASMGPSTGSGNGVVPGSSVREVNLRIPSVSVSASGLSDRDKSGGSSFIYDTRDRPYTGIGAAQAGSSSSSRIGIASVRGSIAGINGQHADPSSAGMKGKGGELQDVISSLEDEFAALNNQYRHLLASMRSPTGADADSPAVESKHAEELVSVIQKLHKKGEQLRALRSPAR